MSDVEQRNISGLTIKIDKTTCIGTANCIRVAPGVFELDDSKICSFKDGATNIEEETLIESCSVCPVSALYVTDKEGKQIIP